MLVRWMLPAPAAASFAGAVWAPAPGAPPEWMPAGDGTGLLASCSRLGGSGALPPGLVRAAAARLTHLLDWERRGRAGVEGKKGWVQ